MATAVRIKLFNGNTFATNVDFDKDEILDIILSPVITINTMIPQNSKPVLHDVTKISYNSGGRELWQLDVTIFYKHLSTKTKVQQVVENNYKVRVYYKFIEYPALYKDFICDNNWEENFIFGDVGETSRVISLFGGVV